MSKGSAYEREINRRIRPVIQEQKRRNREVKKKLAAEAAYRELREKFSDHAFRAREAIRHTEHQYGVELGGPARKIVWMEGMSQMAVSVRC